MAYSEYKGNLDENNQPYGIKQIGNRPMGVSFPEYDEIALGNIAGESVRYVLAYEPSVSLAEKDMWPLAVTPIPIPAVATAMQIVSSSGNDAAAGTGAQQVTVVGLDGTFAEVTQVIATNGTTPVVLATSLIRVNSMTVTAAGANGANQGQIDLVDQATGTIIYTTIIADENNAQSSLFTVPAGLRGVIVFRDYGVTGTEGRIRLKATVNHDFSAVVPGVFRTIDLSSMYDTSATNTKRLPLVVPSQTDIKVTAIDLAGFVSEATASYQLYLIP